MRDHFILNISRISWS